MRIVKELSVLVLALLAAGGLMYGYTAYAAAQPRYDTMTGAVRHVPLAISSPVYGEIMSLPVSLGDQVKKGQTLAVISRLDNGSGITVPRHSDLYRENSNGTIALLSPANGVVNNVLFAEHSTIATAGTLMQLSTTHATQLEVFVPTTDNLQSYQRLYASTSPSGTRIPIQLVRPLPSDAATSAPAKTTAYLAEVSSSSSSAQLLSQNAISITAVRKSDTQHLPSLPSLPKLSLPNMSGFLSH